jgi:hypothetical protein
MALSAPGRPSGEEVVLAAGAPDGAEAEVLDLAEVGLTADDAAADVEVIHDQAVEATSMSDATPVSSAAKATSTSKKRATRTATTTSKARATTPKPTTATTAAKVVIARAAAPPPTSPPTTAPPPTPAPVAGGDEVWDRLAMCESGNTNDHDAPYYGYWQFSEETWHAVGETGLPDEFSRTRQLAAAKRLQAARGWAPWPECARRLGLL